MTDAGSAFATLAAKLMRRAAQLAEARGEAAALARRSDPLRWRSARLLWPLFTKGAE